MFDETPTFHVNPDESRRHIEELTEQGYRPVVNILGAGQLTVRQTVLLHERGTEMVRCGAIIGPCRLGEQIMPGISLYVVQEDESRSNSP